MSNFKINVSLITFLIFQLYSTEPFWKQPTNILKHEMHLNEKSVPSLHNKLHSHY